MKFQVRTAALLAVTLTGASLSGCLVQKDKLPSKTYVSDSSSNLHTYEANDYITYDLIVYAPTGTTTGTLEVKWDQTNNIQDPFSSTTYYPVLKETTDVYSATNASPDYTTSHYIEQDINGSIFLRAIDDPVPNAIDYWLSSIVQATPSTVDHVEVLHSPFVSGDLLHMAFYVMEGCSGSTCTSSLGRLSNDLLTYDTVQVEGTRYGTFSNVTRVTYDTGQMAAPDPTLPFIDFLDICRPSGTTTTHHGTLYIAPEVGVIKIDNYCQPTEPTGGGVVHYVATLRSTNIPLPPLSN